MKHNRLVAGLAVALVAAGLLIGLAWFAPAQMQSARQAITQVVTTVTDTVLPAPSPSPSPVPSPIPTQAPQPPAQPTSLPSPAAPVPFPNPSQMPGCGVCPSQPPALGVSPTPVAIPQTFVSVSVVSVNGAAPKVDKNTGGYTGTPGMTVVYQAYFQGGFPGVSPQFTWTGGGTGASFTVTYSTVGVYRETLKVDEVYNGVAYGAGSVNSVPITVCASGATNASGQCA